MSPPPARSWHRGQLFISYRRDDSAGYARALHEALAQAYGHERVFIDVDDIAAGQRFADVIAQALDAAAVLLVLIGPRWTGPREAAPARIHDPGDFVRREVEAGLARGLHLVPVLLDGTPLPGPDDLPASLHPLLQHHALALGSAGFQAQLQALMRSLAPHMGPAARRSPSPGEAGVSATSAEASGTVRPWGNVANAGIAAAAATAPRRRRWLAGGVALATLAALAYAGGWWAGGRPAVADWVGRWVGEVRYPWPNAVYTEQLTLRRDGEALAGEASFLQVPRVAFDLRLEGDTLRFFTRTESTDGRDTWEERHHYRLQRAADGSLQVEMRTESRGQARAPVRFKAWPAGDGG